MNAPVDAALQQAHQLAEAIEQACGRIAPTWPLDQFIAVNPYWGWLKQPAREAAAHLGVLAGTTLTMPRAWFREQWRAGRLQRFHLEEVARRHGRSPSTQDLVDALESDEPPLARLPLVTDMCDTVAEAVDAHWPDVVTHQISQHCAAYFDTGQARWRLDRSTGLYGAWKRQIAEDRGLAWPGGRRAALERIAALPDDPVAAIGESLAALGIAPAAQVAYLSALLLSINGWAAWCAYERWQARLAGREDDTIVELLAVRASWESVLDGAADATTPEWTAIWGTADARIALLAEEQCIDWLLQEALEVAYQVPLAEALAAAPASAPATTPVVQAVFCIDVRSEVFRRALEAADPDVHTRGFAGFFGLPIAYAPAGSSLLRPQLPGLLAPAVTVTDGPIEGTPLGEVIARRRRSALQWRQRWADLRTSAASGFSFVEACGLAYGAKLLADSLPSTAGVERWEDTGLPVELRGARPRLPQADADPVAAAAMAKGILGAMGLPDRLSGFAPLVLLAGHGSQSTNNPHAAGLDCGACGGQTGEVNARALADMLNTPAVRAALGALGVAIPPGTHFVPGLHNTTTDDVALYDTDRVPSALAGELARLRRALAEAGRRARAERASRLGLAGLAADAEALTVALRERANDWAQVRPEWGLADCAAFVVAPRRRTQGLDLNGRCFLHDYDYRKDEDLAVLELIMTAPMVVTNWINLQYHASTVDNRRYGSGNKVLHNVVGGRIGVFEGNGGDLRIGLPLQSLHDGQTLRHTPLRLSVFIEAPRAAIDSIVARHAVVRDLVDHGWLHLLRIDPEQPWVEQRRQGRWATVAGRASPARMARTAVALPGQEPSAR
jgi:uncharacterized protein YbcC (UPF0753/DUF2309 family)